MNLSKTIAYQVGVKPHMVLGVEVASKPVKYLGAFLDITDVSEMNFKKPLTRVRNNTHKWNKRQITLHARVLVAKTFVTSLFIHILNSVYIQTKQLQLIQCLVNSFVWRG